MSPRNRHERNDFDEKRDTVEDRFNGMPERHYSVRGGYEPYHTDRVDDRQLQNTYTSESPQNAQRHSQVKPARARTDQQRNLRHQRSNSSNPSRSNNEDDQHDQHDDDDDDDEEDSDISCDEDAHSSSAKDTLALAGAILAGFASVYSGKKLHGYYKSHKAKKAGDKGMMRHSTRDLSPPRRPQTQNNSSHPSQYQRRELPATTPLRSNDRHGRPTSAATRRPLPQLAPPPLSRADTEPSPRHIVQVRGASGNFLHSVTGPTRHQSSASDIGHPASTESVVDVRRYAESESGRTFNRSDVNINEETRLKVIIGHKDKPNRVNRCAFLDSGAVADSISEELYDRLSNVGHTTKVDRNIVIQMEGAGGQPLYVLGEAKIWVQWSRPEQLVLPSANSSESLLEKFKFQVIRNLYPHMIFTTRTALENKMRGCADTWPIEDRKSFLIFNLPRKSRVERHQDDTKHEMKRAANMQRTQQEAEERARLRGDSEQLRKPCDQAKSSKPSDSRHSRR